MPICKRLLSGGRWLRPRMWPWGKRLLAFLCAAVVIIFILAEIACHSAAAIFNQTMEKQKMLRGTVTVSSLTAHVNGRVNFEDLVWKDPEGNEIMNVPSGSFRVRIWDIVARDFKPTTITELTLNHAKFAVHFNKDMQIDVIKGIGEKKPDEPKEHKKRSFGERMRNIDWHGRKINTKLKLNHCEIEMSKQGKVYTMTNVNARFDVNTRDAIRVDFSSGTFGGTAIGNGVNLQGIIDMKPEMPTMSAAISFYEVDPSSLGFGMNVHDPMTFNLVSYGPLDDQKSDGHVKMKELHLPALDFYNVLGDVHYEKGVMTFSNVYADVYNGTLAAYGTYNVDTRAYHLYGHGEDLDSRIALHTSRFYCLVDMDLELESNGQRGDLKTSGSFKSGPGYYQPVSFESIQGIFNNQYKKLDFYDVIIRMKMGDIRSDALHIVHGKPTIGTVELTFRDDGRVVDLLKLKPDLERNVKEAEEHYKGFQEALKKL